MDESADQTLGKAPSTKEPVWSANPFVKAFWSLLAVQRIEPLWRHWLVASLFALGISLALAALVHGLLWGLGVDTNPISAPEPTFGAGEFIGVVVIAPLIETVLLAAILKLLSLTRLRRIGIATGSALIFGLFHGLFGALWFFGTVWSFYVFSSAYLAWRPVSFGRAFLAAAVPHSFVNLTAMLLAMAAE